MLLRRLSLVLFVSLTACGQQAGGETDTTTTTTTTTTSITGPSCADIAAKCIANQLGCVEDSAGSRCAPCESGTYAAETGACEELTGTPISHAFPNQTVLPGEERRGQCRSWTLHNDAEIWVNAVELTQTEDAHHANWVFVPDTMYDGPDGIWDGKERDYHFYDAVGAGGVLYAQSTQAAHEVQRFRPGAAVRIPPHSRIVSDIHVLNTSPEAVTGHAELTLYTLPPDEVTTPLTAFHIEYDALDIPAHASARYTGECAVAADVASATGQPFAPKIHYLLPHTHTLATRFFAHVLGGPRDGEALLDLGTYDGEARGRAFDPPVDLTGADGLRFGCEYTNPLDQNVGWGFGSGEMCELFGFAAGTPFFQSRVSTGSAGGAEGAVQLFTGACTTEVYAK